MIPFLFLAHAVIALAAVATRGLESDARGRFLQGASVAGGVFGLALFFGSPLLDETWRTTELTLSGTRLAGMAVAAAWIVVAVGERSRGDGRWDIVALTGTASAALCLYSLNRWTVPALMFAGIASLAIALLHERPGVGIAATATGMALLGGAVLWHTLDATTWDLPTPLTDVKLWIAVAAGVSFALVPILSEAEKRPSPAAPLALGLAYATFGSVARGSGPVVALILVAVALFAVVRSLLVQKASQRVVLAWVVALTLGLAALSPSLYVTSRAGIAGILAASAIVLWPLSLGRGQIERGLLVALVAVTAGFNALAAAATHAFERATSLERVIEAAPWAAIAGILPVALAAGVALGALVGRNPEPESYTRSGVLGSWSLVLLTVIVGVSPYVGETTEGAGVAGPALYVVAVVAGVAAARYAGRLGAAEAPPASTARFLEVPIHVPWPRVASLGFMGLGAATAVVLLVLTYQGLRTGFL
jgi:hypothetical protein